MISKSVTESTSASIRKKVGKTKQLIYEIKAVIEDCRNNIPGAAFTGIQIFEMPVLPYLYSGSENWIELDSNCLKILSDLHIPFYRLLCGAAHSCPTYGLFWELGGTLPENIVMKNKLLLYFHLANLPTNSIGYQIFLEERKLNIPKSFTNECLYF